MPFGWEGKITFSGVYGMRSLNQIRCSLLYNALSALACLSGKTAKLAQSVIFK